MTRINVVPVETLTRQHLVAEYRELPRIFALAYKASISGKPWAAKQPKHYTLGTGHCYFFYDKLGFLANRHKQLTQEMLNRGYKPSYTSCLRQTWKKSIVPSYWKEYEVTKAALRINKERIAERIKSSLDKKG